MRKFLLLLLLILLVVMMLFKSPVAGMYYYNRAKDLYNAKQYDQSLPLFEKSLLADNKNLLTRFYYVLALSKSKPTYDVQKKLYMMGNSTLEDEAKKYARYQAVALRHKLLEGVEDNYIYNATSGNEIIRWDISSFPLKVYFEDVSSVPKYYKQNIDKAFNQWTIRTNFVKFREVTNPDEANIIVKFKDIPEDVCSGNVCKYAVAYTDPIIGPSDKLLKKMNLTFYKTNPLKRDFSSLEVYNTALHEIGHTLGIMGHSDNKSDLMYSSNENNMNMYALYRSDFQYLSLRDLRTLALLYRLEPTISDVKISNKSHLYYSPLILGSNDARLRQKLLELKKYIESYPNLASGYINLAAVYSDSGNFKEALQTLNSASKLVKSSDEEFLVAYNRAIVYYNMQNYDMAMQFAQQANNIKPNQSVASLISDINRLQNLK